MQHLFIGYNQLEGNIPPEIGELTKLESLGLTENRLTGPIPASLGKLVNLVFFGLADNDLSGEIPTEFANLKKLRTFNIRHNPLLTGCIPANLRSVQYNDLSSGDLPFCVTGQ